MSWREFKRGKTKKADVMEFEKDLKYNIYSLHCRLANKTYNHLEYYSFYVKDPKLRLINKACVKDRVLHHAIFRILYSIFDPTFIFDSYSCRIGKGTHRAVNRLNEFAQKVSKNNTKTCYILKLDIKKFFDSINQDILINLIKRKIRDKNVIWLVNKIIKSFPKGLPLGNITSQLFANIYLNELDQFVKHKLKTRHYIRYCDDFVILSTDKVYLEGLIQEISYFLQNNLKLSLHPNKVILRKYRQGVDFLGYVIFPYHIALRIKTKNRMIKKINCQNLQSYLGVLKHCNSHKLRVKISNMVYKMENKFSFNSMGTSFEILIYDQIGQEDFELLKNEIILMTDKFDKKYSRFIKTSFVWQIAGKTGEFEVESEFMDMLEMYFKLYKLSDKKFNPLIGFSISDMGYDYSYSLVAKEHIRPTLDLDLTVKILGKNPSTGSGRVYISEPVLFDFGGVGKGYFVDKISKYLVDKKIKSFLVNGSGDIYYLGNEPIRAGLEDPLGRSPATGEAKDPKKVIGVIEIAGGALAASGSEKRKWGKYHHIIDPVSLTCPSEVLATWVLAENAMLADSLATCLFLCPPENFPKKFSAQGARLPDGQGPASGWEYCILNKDYKIKKSPGFTAELFA